MPAWKPIIGLSFQPDEFAAYCGSLHFATWRPSFVVLHNTFIPCLADRPNGLSKQHILGLQAYYRDTMKWSAGPHLFIDDRQIWVFTPLTTSGVHSPSWNKVSWGVEMLGNYDAEEFNSGRGLKVQHNTVAALGALYETLGIEATDSSLRLHKQDPLTTHKNCPGKNVMKDSIIEKVRDAMISPDRGEHTFASA